MVAAIQEDGPLRPWRTAARLLDHLLLLTATPHKGDPANFSLFLQLLDEDAYADVKSIREAMDRRRAPFYLRRTKEAMVYFPQRSRTARGKPRRSSPSASRTPSTSTSMGRKSTSTGTSRRS